MSEAVVLHRDPGIPGDIHLPKLLPWIRPRHPDGYWHQPRSARLRPDGRVTVSYWCGPFRWIGVEDLSERAPEDRKCGTCVGRRLGFDRADGAIFTPRDDWTPPARCPGSTWDDDGKHCWVCGARVKAAAGWNAWGSATHRPGPELAERWEPCPAHGWRQMRQVGNYREPQRFVCIAHGCDWDGATT